MKPSEELREQREAILRGTWVRDHPTQPGEACLGWRFAPDFSCTPLSGAAERAVGLALGELGWDVPWLDALPLLSIGNRCDYERVNDEKFTSPNDAIEALELAERLAKEAGL